MRHALLLCLLPLTALAADRPGVVGTLGRILGEASVNIAGMQVSRNARGGEALVALTVDSALPPETLEEITDAIGATWSRAADLADKVLTS